MKKGLGPSDKPLTKSQLEMVCRWQCSECRVGKKVVFLKNQGYFHERKDYMRPYWVASDCRHIRTMNEILKKRIKLAKERAKENRSGSEKTS